MFGGDDLAVFVQDFGSACVKTSGSVSFTAILDRPGEVIDLGGVPVLSDEYAITYDPSLVALVRNDAITVDGATYTVRSAPRSLDDGQFVRAVLTKS